MRTMRTPFSGAVIDSEARKKEAQKRKLESNRLSLGTISLSSASASSTPLLRKLVPARVYLPERMTIGQSVKFVVKGKSGSKVAIAMADSNSGSKPVMGKNLRLGSDRKVVAVGKIPDSGVLEVYIGTPIAGDLIGSKLYFEAAVWQKENMSDTQIAETIGPTSESGNDNGVIIAGETLKKRGVRFIPDTAIPLGQRRTQGTSLSSGQP